MVQPPVRNPLAGFALAIVTAGVLSAIAGYACTYIPYTELRLFFLAFALFGIGTVAGRKTFLGSLGAVGAYLGGFIGLYLTEQVFWVNAHMELYAMGLALAAALGGFISGKLGVVRLNRVHHFASTVRRCPSCGERVGPSANKCWSCKASLSA